MTSRLNSTYSSSINDVSTDAGCTRSPSASCFSTEIIVLGASESERSSGTSMARFMAEDTTSRIQVPACSMPRRRNSPV